MWAHQSLLQCTHNVPARLSLMLTGAASHRCRLPPLPPPLGLGAGTGSLLPCVFHMTFLLCPFRQASAPCTTRVLT